MRESRFEKDKAHSADNSNSSASGTNITPQPTGYKQAAKNMKQYSQDYTKVSEAESHLYAAQQLNAHDDPIEAWKHIEDARRLLQEYLAQDNMVEDNDVADGWVKAHEVEELINGKENEEDPWNKDWLQMKLEVVKLHVEGRSISEIAAKTGAATQTVKGIITKFMEG